MHAGQFETCGVSLVLMVSGGLRVFDVFVVVEADRDLRGYDIW